MEIVVASETNESKVRERCRSMAVLDHRGIRFIPTPVVAIANLVNIPLISSNPLMNGVAGRSVGSGSCADHIQRAQYCVVDALDWEVIVCVLDK